MTREQPNSIGSWQGMQGWIVSFLFHALVLTLLLPIVRHLAPPSPPEPFRLTVSLIESLDSTSHELATAAVSPSREHHPTDALTSQDRSIALRASTTRSNGRGPSPETFSAIHTQASDLAEMPPDAIHDPVNTHAEDLIAAERPLPPDTSMVQPNRSHTVPEPDLLTAPAPLLQHTTATVPGMAGTRELSTVVETITARVNVPAQSTQRTSEPTPSPLSTLPQASENAPVMDPLPPPVIASASMSSRIEARSVPAPQADQATWSENKSRSVETARLPDHASGSSVNTAEREPIQRDAVPREFMSTGSPVSTKPRSDYSWLQQALSRRLDELTRSSRPSMEESGILRVLLKAVVSNTGELIQAEILKSSGHPRIDQEAITLIQRAFPMSLDRDLDRPSIAMRIPVTFSHN